jgi:ribose transport system ATP-binding protein
MRGVSKSFGGIHALEGVDLTVRRGKIHAIVGHNGAGKSTLIKCLAGAYSPSRGDILIDGQPLAHGVPGAALAAGIRVVYQELSLFPSLTVAENLATGRQEHGLVRWRERERRARDELAELGLSIDPRSRVEQLSVGRQQMIEIARALSSGARLVVLDEPTSALSHPEAAELFRLVRRLADQGVAFLLISHFLNEVLEHADEVTVLRSGRRVDSLPVAGLDARTLVQLSLGDVDEVMASTYEDAERRLPSRTSAPVLVRAQNVSSPPTVKDMSLDVGVGEVVVVYGELGAGQEELCETVFGLHPVRRGTLNVLGHRVHRASPEFVRDLGVGFIPADRRRALALANPIYQNISLANLRQLARVGVRQNRERELADQLIQRLGIRGATPNGLTAGLSGGNQQKALFARWLVTPPRLLVLCEPTRGMDVRAKSEVLRVVQQLARQGTGVLIATSEPETALAVADRVLVASRGRLVADLADRTITNHDLVEAAA